MKIGYEKIPSKQKNLGRNKKNKNNNYRPFLLAQVKLALYDYYCWLANPPDSNKDMAYNDNAYWEG